MPTNTLVFNVEDRRARAAFSRLKREVDSLENEFNTTRSEARAAGEAIDRLGDQSRTTARDVDRLGDEAQRSATRIDGLGIAARRQNTVWRDTNGRLRDARGRFVAAGQGADLFARSLGGVRGLLTGLGAALAAREMFEFGIASVRSAGQMEGLLRGLRAIEGSQADARLRDFNEIAKLPGLNTPQIIRYSNSLRAAGATAQEVDHIIITFGQSIVGLGGNAADTSRAMLQLTQAFGENKISQENFSTIKELIPSFNRLSQEVYNTDGTMDDLNKRFQASGQTLGQFLLPILARLRQEIPAAPVDSYARSIDALQEEFNQLQIAIGDKLLPVVSSAARGFAELFNNVTNFIQNTNEAKQSVEGFTTALSTATAAGAINKAFEDRIAFLRQEKAALDAAAEGRANYFRFRGRDTEAGRRYKEITTELERLTVAQGSVAAQSEYLQNIQNGLVTQARALTTEITDLRNEIDGRTGKSVIGLNRRLQAKRAALAEVQKQIGTNANALRALAAANTAAAPAIDAVTESVENYALTLSQLRATAEDTRTALSDFSIFSPELTSGFQAALAASNAYYAERIRQAETALAAETQGTEAHNAIETRIFELKRQRLQAEQQLQAVLSQKRQEQTARTIEAEQKALQALGEDYREYRQILNSVLEIGRAADFHARIEALRAQGLTFQQSIEPLREYAAFLKEITTFENLSPAETAYRRFTASVGQGFEAATRRGYSFLDVLQQITEERFDQIRTADLNRRIPNPATRQAAIDERLATRGTGEQTLDSIRTQAREQGRIFIEGLRERQNAQQDVQGAAEQTLQRRLTDQVRLYRQFARTVSSLLTGVVTGRIRGFEEVARSFIAQSVQIIARAVIEHQIQLRLDNALTAAKISNIQKVNAAQATGAGGLGGIPGLGNLPGLGRLGGALSGGGAALGVSGLLFPEELKNLAGGISDTIGNLLSNISSAPDRAFGAQQVFLKIGDQEARDISDLQDELRQEARV